MKYKKSNLKTLAKDELIQIILDLQDNHPDNSKVNHIIIDDGNKGIENRKSIPN